MFRDGHATRSASARILQQGIQRRNNFAAWKRETDDSRDNTAANQVLPDLRFGIPAEEDAVREDAGASTGALQ